VQQVRRSCSPPATLSRNIFHRKRPSLSAVGSKNNPAFKTEDAGPLVPTKNDVLTELVEFRQPSL